MIDFKEQFYDDDRIRPKVFRVSRIKASFPIRNTCLILEITTKPRQELQKFLLSWNGEFFLSFKQEISRAFALSLQGAQRRSDDDFSPGRSEGEERGIDLVVFIVICSFMDLNRQKSWRMPKDARQPLNEVLMKTLLCRERSS